MPVISQKICLIGDFGVGKTSLIRRFVDRQFSDRYLSTVGVKISRKILEVKLKDTGNIVQLQLLIWDIEGKSKFKRIVPSYLQGAKGAIIVADLNRQETLAHITEHIESFFAVNPLGSKVIIALNKCDLIDLKQLTNILEKNQFIGDDRILYTYVTSAKTGKDVDLMFEQLAENLIVGK